MATACVLTLSAQGIYDFKVKDSAGQEVSLSDYKGKVLLIVNTATRCGFTPQYKELEAMCEKYRDVGLEILSPPSFDNPSVRGKDGVVDAVAGD